MGQANDAAVTNPASSGSVIALLKGLLTNLGTSVFGAGTAAAAQRVTLASDDPLKTWLNDGTQVTQVSGAGYTAQVTITRPSDTAAYNAGDVVGDTSGSAIITFATIGPTAGHVWITGVDLRVDLSAVPSGMTSFRLHLYSASPTAIADNAAWDLVSGDRAAYLGYVDVGSPADLVSTLFVQTDNINKKVKLASASTTLYGLLVTNGAYTPTSAATLAIRLHTEGA
jgi:hypothetical protein